MERRQFLIDGPLAAGALAGRNKGRMSSEEFPPEQIVLRTNGFAFDAFAAGPKDGQLILLLHGFPQFADSWTSVMRPLSAAGYRVVAVNQRGYSKDARPPLVSDYALDKLALDAGGFADVLNAPQFHLVGHDWGGAVAWRVGAAYPKRLHTLSALSTPHVDALTLRSGRIRSNKLLQPVPGAESRGGDGVAGGRCEASTRRVPG